MNNLKSLIAVAVLCWMSTATSAQNLMSGYFADDYHYRHDLNPAFANRQSYVAMPGIGNLNVNMNSNLRADKVFYNIDGRTALFIHPKVDAGSFLSAVKDKNKINVDLHEQLLGFGFKGMGGYNTFEINARANVSANIPGSLLRLAKEGAENQTYDISDFRAHADAYGEIALGHSRQITDQWRIGAKMKFLLGVVNIDANFDKAQLALGETEWVGVTNAKIQTSLNEMRYDMESKMRGPEGQQTEHRYVCGIEKSKWGISGFGLAFDLGAEYKYDNNWSFSAALLDLGYIGWKNNYVASTNGDKTIHTSKYIFSVDDDKDNSFENEGDRLAEGLSELYELEDNGNAGSRSRGLAATMNLGVEYTPDFYRKMSFGLTNSTRMGKFGWTDFRLSANVAPTNIFSASANVALGTYGFSFGWLLNFHPTGFNLFLGMDHTLSKLAKQGLPLSGRGNINVGINIPFGNNKTKKMAIVNRDILTSQP